uniref:Uncharacterized protein n=1 Tax=Guillardia theta TaxID=55529 RepID=A0A7S4H9L6_GUITH|mmetsp:Transcript_11413/g.39043  ORF Transcript_11413/g.39043 Transcript_11413/m.39043 type:complete len:270 (+) Transcript_11413:647-1456(+)
MARAQRHASTGGGEVEESTASGWKECQGGERLKSLLTSVCRGEKLVINGLRSMFEVQERRGNRQAARKFGEGGLFQQEGGRWLKRMWKDNAWAEPGGIRGSMRNGPTNCSERHHPVADGFAPARIVGDGWGAKKWPQKGRCAREAVVRGAQHLTLQPHREQQAQPILNRDDVWKGQEEGSAGQPQTRLLEGELSFPARRGWKRRSLARTSLRWGLQGIEQRKSPSATWPSCQDAMDCWRTLKNPSHRDSMGWICCFQPLLLRLQQEHHV